MSDQCAPLLSITTNMKMKIGNFSLKNICCIQYAGSSGSYLLSNLLDGHPEVLSMPPHSIFDGPFLLQKIVTDLNINASSKDFAEKLLSTFPLIITPNEENIKMHAHFLGASVLKKIQFGINPQKFIVTFEEITTPYWDLQKKDVKFLFFAMHLAYALSQNKAVAGDVVIAWQRHNFLKNVQIKYLDTIFNELIYITTLRNPVKAIDSHILNRLAKFKDSLKNDCMVNQLVINTIHLFFIALSKKNTKSPQILIKFEDLHEKTEKTMQLLCDYLNIKYHNSLLSTTLDNHVMYYKNQHTGELISGLNPLASTQNQLKFFSEADAVFIKILLSEIYEKFYPDLTRPFNKIPALMKDQNSLDTLTGIISNLKNLQKNSIDNN